MKSDANKSITNIEYNYLKLPKKITKNGTDILYQYSASGTQATDYVGNIIYKNGVLYQIGHDEGRVVNDVYEYDIRDYLGSLRVSFKDSVGIAKITQANSYGIFGEELPSLSYQNTPNLNNYKFTDKENLPQTGYTDFGARFYDNLVPRFISIDPLAETSRRFSPYTYGNNNPVRFIDPDGMASKAIDGSVTFSGYVGDDGNGNFIGTTNGDDKPKKKTDTNDKSKKTAKLPTVAEVTSNGLNPNGDGIQSDYTIESIVIPILKPVEWAFRALKYRFLIKAAQLETTKGGEYVVETIAGFYVRGKLNISHGVYERTIQALANYDGKSLFNLVRAFENEARVAGVNKVVINGIDIVETRLISPEGAKLLGYSFKQTSSNSIQLIKNIK